MTASLDGKPSTPASDLERKQSPYFIRPTQSDALANLSCSYRQESLEISSDVSCTILCSSLTLLHYTPAGSLHQSRGLFESWEAVYDALACIQTCMRGNNSSFRERNFKLNPFDEIGLTKADTGNKP